MAQSKPFVEAKNFALKFGTVNSNGDHEFIHTNQFPLQLTEFGIYYGFLYRYDQGDYIVIGKTLDLENIFYVYYDGVQKIYYSYIHDYGYATMPIRDYKEYTEEEATKLAEGIWVEFSNLLVKEDLIWKGAIK
jgi:hypothetical protein